MTIRSYNEADSSAVPTAILPGKSIEEWFIAPTRYCATGKGKPGGATFNDRFDLSSSDKDPVKLIPEQCSALRAWLDFLPDWWVIDDDFGLNMMMLVVNHLEAPLTIRLEGGDAIHGAEAAYPAKRSWDARHKRHVWDDLSSTNTYTIPAGNHADGSAGVGLVGIQAIGAQMGSAAVWSISTGPEEPNLKAPLWVVGGALWKRTDGRCYGIRVSDDTGAYTDPSDFYEKEMHASRASHTSCALKKGEDAMHPDANYTAQGYIAMIDPAPTGSSPHYIKLRKQYRTAQAVLVIDTEGSGAAS